VKRKQSEQWTGYSQKALHSYFVRSRYKNVDKLASSYWHTKGDLIFETEGLLIAARNKLSALGQYNRFTLAQLTLSADYVTVSLKQ